MSAIDRTSAEITLDLKVIEEMLRFHGERLSHYRERKLQLSFELNRARRLEREKKELLL